jgi:hypothetical protein
MAPSQEPVFGSFSVEEYSITLTHDGYGNDIQVLEMPLQFSHSDANYGFEVQN